MARIFCKYHPDVPARWICRACQIPFCSQCIPGEGEAAPACPVCRQAVESLGAGNVIEPFWQRLPAIFAWPLQRTPLLFMLALSGLGLLVAFLLGGSLFGWLLGNVVLYAVFLKYAYVVLENTAQGHLEPEPITWHVLADELELPFKQFFILFLIAAINDSLYRTGGGGLMLAGLFLTTLLLPASIMVLAIERRLLAAINPIILIDVMRRIGMPYLLLWLFLFLLISGLNETGAYLYHYLPVAFAMPLDGLLGNYVTLVVFHLLGYTLYQYHEALGVPIHEAVAAPPAPAGNAAVPGPLREVEILFHEGRHDAARERLLALIGQEPGNMLYRERLHRLLINLGDRDGLRRHSGEYVSRLLLHGKPSEALRVFTECYRVDREFKFGDARQRHRMAELLANNGQDRAALALLNNLHRDFPQYPGVPDAYRLVARLLSEKFNQDDRARQVLDFIEQRYPDYPHLDEVRAYRQVIEQVAGNG